MQIFLSYASQDGETASAINRALLEQGHDVFFDREDLPPGEEYHGRIRRAIERSDLFIVLLSEYAVDAGSYTLNEIEFAEHAFPHASGRVLPVIIGPIPIEQIPIFAKSVTLLQSPGNIVAATAAAVHRIARRRRNTRLTKLSGALALSAVFATVVVLARRTGTADVTPVTDSAGAMDTAPRDAPSGTNAAGEIVTRDGVPLILVPGGMFVMGDNEESPRRDVYVDSFYIDRVEVTVARYATFFAATGGVGAPDEWEPQLRERVPNLPVVGVSWDDAAAYCQWVGRRLPTETEWEKAARGIDERRYPWGNVSPTLDNANFQNMSPEAYGGGLSDVGTHAAGVSPYGVHDMAGNAYEWVADWYASGFPVEDRRNPRGPPSGEARVLRGGGRFDQAERLLSTSRYKASPETRGMDIGFRCGRDFP